MYNLILVSLLGITKNSKVTNVGSKVETDALQRFAEEVCEAGTDEKVYFDNLAPVFMKRYEAMKRNPAQCCRTKNL